MKQFTASVVPLCVWMVGTAPVFADGAFYGDPPNETHPWAIHDMNRPQPPRVEPGTPSTQEQPGKPPSDAIVLLDGTPASLAKWESGKNPGQPAPWKLTDGALQVVPGSGEIRTREQFGDCQLHVEWSAPTQIQGNSQGRSNSGIFLTGDTEVQVLDNYNNPTYADGFAGSVYGVNPPHANALQAPGKWQFYDIIFRRPVFKDGKMVDSGRLTVTINGVVVQDSTPLEGGGGHKGRSKDRPFPDAGPLKLQDHGNPIRFRNIWYRPLPKRAVEGGDMGAMDPAAATAKKLEIAKSIRLDAESKQGEERLLRLMESLCYASDDATVKTIDTALGNWTEAVKKTPANGMEAKKGSIMRVFYAVRYLTGFKLYQDSAGRKGEIEQIIRAAGWDPR
ncbi:MAG: DUF1080 domain-containing protein [Verrucomicrobia bacterium]|nr:DUF1080 domain-containing protein [Verrucomicrobiota bacterium]